MHVCVIGAGVIGVATAYYLAREGHDVTVIDRESEVAGCASHANGGQLSYSFTDALAKPEYVARIPGLIAGQDRGSRVSLAPSMLPWGIRFLSQCTSQRAQRNTLDVLKMAMRSAQLLKQLQRTASFDFSHRAAGKLVLLSDIAELDAAKGATALKNAHGCDARILTRDEAITLEPALVHFSMPFIGAVYSAGDEVADARRFAVGLKQWLVDSGHVAFKMGRTVTRLCTSGKRVHSVQIGDEHIDVDATIVCGGAWSGQLLRPLGINPQIYPVRGYSVTLPPSSRSPNVSVTALKQRIVFSRINGDMRIAGFADFRGFNTSEDQQRIAALLDIAHSTAPQSADFAAPEQQPWGGFRPMTPNGQPRVGKTKIKGLYLNTGHGMLGWTLACASGFDVAAAIAESHH